VPAAALAGLHLLLVPLACRGQVCNSPLARGGKSVTWPVPNPMLVAPVNISYHYESYRHPLLAELTGEGLAISIPPDFTAGFNMTNPSNGTSELYILRSIQLRKPGRVPEGGKQVLSHILEAALVHQEITGTGYWANVIVPFQVGTDILADMLTHLTDEATLPSSTGEIQPLLVSDARPLRLNEVWNGASFYHSWTTLPTGCQGVTAPTRQMMRNTTITVGQYTFHRLLDALHNIPEGAPQPPPKLSWELVGCPEVASQGPCVPLSAKDLQPELTQAMKIQSDTLRNMRNRKVVMDQILVELKNKTLNSLMSAIAARDSLRDAESTFESAVRNVDKLQDWVWQAGNATWDADAPPRTGKTVLLEVQASLPTLRGPGVRSPLLLQARRHSEQEGAALNLLFGSGSPRFWQSGGQPLLRPRALRGQLVA